MRARAGALAADEIAVRRGDATLAAADRVAVGADAHRAAGRAPRESRVPENAIETFLLGLGAHLLGAGRRQRGHLRLAALEERSRRAQVGETAVRARPDEYL